MALNRQNLQTTTDWNNSLDSTSWFNSTPRPLRLYWCFWSSGSTTTNFLGSTSKGADDETMGWRRIYSSSSKNDEATIQIRNILERRLGAHIDMICTAQTRTSKFPLVCPAYSNLAVIARFDAKATIFFLKNNDTWTNFMKEWSMVKKQLFILIEWCEWKLWESRRRVLSRVWKSHAVYTKEDVRFW